MDFAVAASGHGSHFILDKKPLSRRNAARQALRWRRHADTIGGDALVVQLSTMEVVYPRRLAGQPAARYLEPDFGTKSSLRPTQFDRYEGHSLEQAAMETIWSVGRTPYEAVQALCRVRFLNELSGALRPIGGQEDPHSPYAWGCRFTCNGTHFKAAGLYVPGGVVLTWWK